MTDKAALRALLEKVKAGTAQDTDFAQVFPSESAYGHCTWHDAYSAFHGSVDAAIAFHEAVRPGWSWLVRSGDEEDYENRNRFLANIWPTPDEEFTQGEIFPVWADNPARALLIADLESMLGDAE